MKVIKTLTIAAALSAVLSGCMVSRDHLSSDFGAAARQDRVAQITNPDGPPPGPGPKSNGLRAAVAMQRYETDTTYQPRSQDDDPGISPQSSLPPAAPPPAAASGAGS